jgi:hypothetical protein
VSAPARAAAPVVSLEDRSPRKGDGHRWTKWYLGLHKRVKLDSKALAVAGQLVKRANNNTGYCYPSLKDIHDGTGLSRHSIQRGIQDLELAGLISVERGGPKQGSSHYWLLDLHEDERLDAAATAALAASDRSRRHLEQKAAAVVRNGRGKDARLDSGRATRRGPQVAPGQLELGRPEQVPQVVPRLVPDRHQVVPHRDQGGATQGPGTAVGTTKGIEPPQPPVNGGSARSHPSDRPPRRRTARDEQRERQARRLAALERLANGGAG